MFRIALCEDEESCSERSLSLLNGYIAARELSARVWSFRSARELLEAMFDGPFDIYLLDIVMPGMNGIELGREIRRTDPDGSIIYLTSSVDFALEGYQARAVAYLLKPATQEKLFGVLDDAVALRRRRKEASIIVRTHEGPVCLLLEDIYYAELRNRCVCYFMKSGSVESVTVSMAFRDAVAPLLNSGVFLLCGSSFAVNLFHIKMVDKGGALFANGQHLTLPRSACAPLRSAWMHYWLEGGSEPC